MRFGFHISISGGLSKVAQRAVDRDCQTIQVFSRNPRGWKYGPLSPDEVRLFQIALRRLDISPVVVHMPYLPNPASPDADLYRRSIDSLAEELRRAQQLGAAFVVVHVGKHMGSPIGQALKRVAVAINQTLEQVETEVLLLLEGTAGQGTEIGHSFSQIRDIFAQLENPNRVGVCLDTAHIFEAGYDIATDEGLEKTLQEFAQLLGLDRLHLLHLNDSKPPLGSHVDRHWHIGEGEIGREGFRRIINHPRLRSLPGIMETPAGEAEDAKNMRTVRDLVL